MLEEVGTFTGDKAKFDGKMLKSIARSLGGKDRTGFSIKVDELTGFAEFPGYGESKKNIFPDFVDPETDGILATTKVEKEKKVSNDAGSKEFWMPDQYCKYCYGCDEAFSIYKRRHHCRMCGQIFCNNCSNFYIDGLQINLQGQQRACRHCYDQINERMESKSSRRQELVENDDTRTAISEIAAIQYRPGKITELPMYKRAHSVELQRRSSLHNIYHSCCVLRL